MWPLAIAAVVIAGLVVPRARRPLLILALCAACLALIGGGYLACLNWRNERDLRRRHALIPFDAIEVRDARLGVRDYGGYSMTGRIHNRSSHDLSSLTLRVRILDCDARQACDTVADERVWLTGAVPAGQSRDFAETLYPQQRPQIRGAMQWNYQIAQTEAAH